MINILNFFTLSLANMSTERFVVLPRLRDPSRIFCKLTFSHTFSRPHRIISNLTDVMHMPIIVQLISYHQPTKITFPTLFSRIGFSCNYHSSFLSSSISAKVLLITKCPLFLFSPPSTLKVWFLSKGPLTSWWLFLVDYLIHLFTDARAQRGQSGTNPYTVASILQFPSIFHRQLKSADIPQVI